MPRRRLLHVLLIAQALGGLCGAAATATALLALDMTGSEALASLPLAVLVAGSAGLAVPVSALSRRAGRRTGLSVALVVAAAGALAAVAAGAWSSFPLLLVAMAAFGAGTTAVMLARYAAADISTPEHRGRAIGSVVFATTFGAVAGPNLLEPAGGLAGGLGLPRLTGLFVVAVGAFLLAAVLLAVRLRPDPREMAAALGSDAGETGDGASTPLTALLAPPAARAGLATLLVANFAMVAVMAMAPVHLRHHGHGLEMVGLVVSLHIAGMFAPAPLTGWLTDRAGAPAVAGGGAGLLVAAGVVAAAAGGRGVPFTGGLVLLGLGWNACLVAGSALLAAAVPTGQRPRVEAAGELGMGVAAGIATALAGPVVALAGYGTLALLGAACGAGLAALLAVAASWPQAAAMSRPRVSRTVARTPCSSSTARNASIASGEEPSYRDPVGL